MVPPVTDGDDTALDALRSDAELSAIDKENTGESAFEALANATLKAPLKPTLGSTLPRPVRRNPSEAAPTTPNSVKWRKPTTPQQPPKMGPIRSPLTPRSAPAAPSAPAVAPRKRVTPPESGKDKPMEPKAEVPLAPIRIDSSCASCTELHERLRATEARSARQGLLIHKLEVDLTNATQDVAQFQAEYDKLRAEGADLYKSYESKCKTIKGYMRIQEDLDEKIEEKNATIAELEAQCKKHQEAVQGWKEKCRVQANEFRTNFTQYRILSEEHARLKADHEDALTRLAKAEERIGEEAHKSDALRMAATEADRRCAELEATVRSLTAELENARKQVAAHPLPAAPSSSSPSAKVAGNNYRAMAHSLVDTMIQSALARFPTHAIIDESAPEQSHASPLQSPRRQPASDYSPSASPRRVAFAAADRAAEAAAAAHVAMLFSDSPHAIITRAREAHESPSQTSGRGAADGSVADRVPEGDSADRIQELERELEDAEAYYTHAMIGWARAKVEIECLKKRLGEEEDEDMCGSCRDDDIERELKSCDTSLNDSLAEADDGLAFESVDSPAAADALFREGDAEDGDEMATVGGRADSFGHGGSPFVVEYAHLDGPVRGGAEGDASPSISAGAAETHAQLQAECESLAAELADARAALEAARMDAARALADVEEKLRAAECDGLNRAHECASLKAMMTAQEGELAALASDVESLEEAKASLERQNDALRDAEAEYVGRISEMKLEWDERGRTIAALQAERESLTAAVAAAERRERELQDAVGRFDAERKALSERIETLEEELSVAQAVADETAAMLTCQKEESEEALREREDRAKEVASLEATIETLRASNAEMEATNRSLENDKFELEALVAKLREAEASLTAECTRLSEEAECARRQRDELSEFVEEERQVRAEIESDLEKSLADARAQCEAGAAAHEAAKIAHATELDSVRTEADMRVADMERRLSEALASACTAECARNRRIAADAAARIEAAEARARLVEENVVRGLKREVESRDLRIAELQASSSATEASLERALECLDDVEKRYEAREKDVVQPMLGELRDLRAKLRACEKDRQSLTERLDSAIGMSDGVRRESYAKFVVEKEALQAEIAALRDRIASLSPLEGEVAQLKKYIRELTERADKKISILQDNLRKAEEEVESLDALVDAVRAAFEGAMPVVSRTPALAAVYEQVAGALSAE